jgi:hypothetical protein
MPQDRVNLDSEGSLNDPNSLKVLAAGETYGFISLNLVQNFGLNVTPLT